MTEYIVDLAQEYVSTTLGMREEIIRCEDCKHYRHYDKIPAHKDWCLRGSGDYCVQVYPNGFCAWGERRDDD